MADLDRGVRAGDRDRPTGVAESANTPQRLVAGQAAPAHLERRAVADVDGAAPVPFHLVVLKTCQGGPDHVVCTGDGQRATVVALGIAYKAHIYQGQVAVGHAAIAADVANRPRRAVLDGQAGNGHTCVWQAVVVKLKEPANAATVDDDLVRATEADEGRPGKAAQVLVWTAAIGARMDHIRGAKRRQVDGLRQARVSLSLPHMYCVAIIQTDPGGGLPTLAVATGDCYGQNVHAGGAARAGKLTAVGPGLAVKADLCFW